MHVSVPVRVLPLGGYANDADVAAAVLSAHVDHREYVDQPRPEGPATGCGPERV